MMHTFSSLKLWGDHLVYFSYPPWHLFATACVFTLIGGAAIISLQPHSYHIYQIKKVETF